MKKRLFGMALASALFLSLLAPAASADITGTGVFQGTASVGKYFKHDAPCTKEGIGEPEGQGLYAPLIIERRPEGTWSLTTTFTAVGADGTEDAGAYVGAFNVCGWLDAEPVAGLGGACGASKGFGGRGMAELTNPVTGHSVTIKVFNLSWKEALLGVLPVTGNYEEYDSNGIKTGKVGTILATVAVFPTNVERCLDATTQGAQAFTTVGDFVLFQPFVDAGKDPDDGTFLDQQKGGPKSCKAPATQPDQKPNEAGSQFCPEPGSNKP